MLRILNKTVPVHTDRQQAGKQYANQLTKKEIITTSATQGNNIDKTQSKQQREINKTIKKKALRGSTQRVNMPGVKLTYQKRGKKWNI